MSDHHEDVERPMAKHASAPIPGRHDDCWSQCTAGDCSTTEQSALQLLRDVEKCNLGRQTSFIRMGTQAASLFKRYVRSLQTGATTIKDEPISGSCSNSLKRLVLHVDLNKTILMSDAVQDADMSSVVNMLLSECTWGRLELQADGTPHWEPVGRLATDRPYGDEELMTYRQYLDTFLLPYDDSKGPDSETLNNQVKRRRQELKRCFTDEGQPGEMFCGVHRQLCRKLALPENESVGEFLQGRTERHIVPSFFNLLIFLQEEDLDFTLVFRTFGSDLADVATEMNLFATGNHPSFPGVKMDGSDGRVDLRLHEDFGCFGAVHRDGLGKGGTRLAMGVPISLLSQKSFGIEDLVGRADDVLEGGNSSAVPATQSSSPAKPAYSQLLYSGFDEIHSALNARANQPGCHAMAIRDYYPFWKHHNERSHAGKLLLHDPDDNSTLHMFFDDNIGWNDGHIVDVRDVRTGAPIPFNDVNHKHLIKVEALNAILDPKYFIRAIVSAVHTNLQVSPAGTPSIPNSEDGKSSLNRSLDSPSSSSPLHKPMMPKSVGAKGSLGDLMKASSLLNRSPETPHLASRKSPRAIAGQIPHHRTITPPVQRTQLPVSELSSGSSFPDSPKFTITKLP